MGAKQDSGKVMSAVRHVAIVESHGRKNMKTIKKKKKNCSHAMPSLTRVIRELKLFGFSRPTSNAFAAPGCKNIHMSTSYMLLICYINIFEMKVKCQWPTGPACMRMRV